MRKTLMTFALLMLLGLSPLTQQAQAWSSVRIGIGIPLYVGPGPYYYGYPYRYYYPPAYVVPAPAVVYQTAPPAVVVPPVVNRSEPIPVAPAPQADASSARVTPSAAPLPTMTNVIPLSKQSTPQVDALVRQLSQTSETARRDTALQLGRLKATSAAPLPPVTNVVPLSNQSSPQVDALVKQLSQTSETARRDAALQLGRMKATSSVDALADMLAKDTSPIA